MSIVLKPKILDGKLCFFARAEGDAFVVTVEGQERLITRDSWNALRDAEVEGGDDLHQLDRWRDHR